MSKQILCIGILIFAYNAIAEVSIKDISFKSPGKIGKLVINYDGSLKDYPTMSVKNGFIDIVIPESKVRNKINKQFSFSTKTRDTTITVEQKNSKSVRAKISVPFNIKKYESKVAMILKDNRIEISFPKIAVKLPKVAPKLKAKAAMKVKNVKKLDASFLDTLIEDEKAKTKVTAKSIFAKKSKAVDVNENLDSVKTSSAGVEKQENKSFMGTYIAKFAAFLGVIIVGFYGIVALFKKGVAKKGKLGFLNKNELVEVISSTHVGPKKSMMLVRAHEQVFLVSNTDHGLTLLSEINDVNGLLKDGEKKAAGFNFDDRLETSTNDELNDNNVTLKKDITESKPINTKEAIKDYLVVGNTAKPKAKFSDQIKEKIKDLKPMQ